VDLSSIVGILIGITAVIGTVFLESGSVSAIIQPDAALIVLGGTIGAGMVNFSTLTLINSIKDLKTVFFEDSPDFNLAISRICDLANIARQQGQLIIQDVIPNIEDTFLKKCLKLSIDTNNQQFLQEAFDFELEMEEEKGLITSIFYETLGGYAPTFGIIGAVIGLIQVMKNIENPAELGYGISTAFVATLYGVGAANIVFLPIAGKLRYRLREKLLYKKLIVQGILAINKSENPVLIKEKLLNYLNFSEKYDLNDFSSRFAEN